MPSFLTRFRRRGAPVEGPGLPTHSQRSPPTAAASAAGIGLKIHPNLKELIPRYSPPSPTTTRTPAPINKDGIIPLKPRPRTRSINALGAPVANHDLSPSEIPLPPSPAASVTESITTSTNHNSCEHAALMHTPLTAGPMQSPVPPSSWSTFGRKVMRGAKTKPNIIDASRSRPSSAGSRTTSQRSHTHTPTSTNEDLVEPFTPFASISSGSAPSSGFTFGHGAVASRMVPPLPPLNHPAFQETGVEGLPIILNDNHEVAQLFADKQPRPSTSLPSIPSSSRLSWSLRPKLQDIFPVPSSNLDSPVNASRQSDTSRGSRKRRFRRSKSASMVDQHEHLNDGSLTLPYPENSNIQARGNSSQASGAFGLGSPFLLQSASAPGLYNLTTSTADEDSYIVQNNLAPTGMSIDNVVTSPALSKPRSSPDNKMAGRPPVLPASPPSTLLMPPLLSVTRPTPESSPVVEHTTPSKGKRKAEEVEGSGGTPPEAKKSAHQKTTFAQDPRPHRASGNSGSSHAPSSFHRSKRARISGSGTPNSSTIVGVMSSLGEDSCRPASRSGSHQQNASNTGSWASRTSALTRTQSRTSGRNPSSHKKDRTPSEAPSRRSLSQASIPISALISPHAPSISQRSTTYHMRDPRKPAPVQPTPWSLTLPERGWQRWSDGGGSPIHAWLFFVGFVLFPLWWIAFFLSIPRTRHLHAGAEEKGVILDDPQVEHDALSWRRRCRVMAVVSLFTYVPFIVCVAIFAPR